MQQDAASSRRRAGVREHARGHGTRARRPRRWLALVALLAGAALLQPATAQAAPSATAPAFSSLGSCLAQHNRLLLAFVMDESGSLGDASRNQAGSDPTGQRVTAAQVAVQGLTGLARRGVDVQVLLSGFSDDFHQYGNWQTLDQATSGSISSQLDGFRSQDQGLDTDFYTAMAGVQSALAAQDRAAHGDACEVVLLFTDGRFDISTNVAKPYDANGADPDATKVAKGVAALCAPAGPMQALRNANAETITLALADPSAPSIDQPDRAFLSRLATGDCSSAGADHGASFDAANASDLVDQFDAIVSSIRGGTQRLGDCVGSAHSFDIVPALSGFHVLADVGRSPQDVVLTAPDHRAVRVSTKGVVSPASTDVTMRATVTNNEFVAIDAAPAASLDPSSSAWTGRWSVNFSSTQPGGRCQVFLFDGWKPALQPVMFRPGKTTDLVLGLVTPAGQPARLAELHAAHHITATIGGAKGTPTPLQFTESNGLFHASYQVPKSLAGQPITLDAVFHVNVGGTDVASSPLSLPIRVAASATAPAPAQGSKAVPRPAPVAITVAGASSTSKSKLVLKVALIAVALALLLLLILLRRSRRGQPTFVEPSRLRTARVQVRVRRHGPPTRLFANGTESPLGLNDSDFAPCPVGRGAIHAFAIDELSFEATTARRLFSPGYGEVGLPRSYVTASGGTTLGSGFTKGRVPLKLRGTWVYELEAADEGDEEREPFVDGWVTVFVAGDAPIGPQAKKLVDSFNSFLTEIVLRLAKHAPAKKAEAPQA